MIDRLNIRTYQCSVCLEKDDEAHKKMCPHIALVSPCIFHFANKIDQRLCSDSSVTRCPVSRKGKQLFKPKWVLLR